ncbi:nitroreductase [Paenibacillus sp. OAS669]|uniref:nitroreductase family protein n=1 Tax=Paenibacillus sp. OAS669 TaxID=2663821 RepID=UPI00178955A5|nr:nitroreductase [Paenibacillus sp. OAS669]MBE1442445.1 nitroreductase [Paenibacillus sp. OAS669]
MTRTDTKPAGSVAELIKQRRTIRLFKSDEVPTELLKELLNVAVWAPNHEYREPWRFILFQGEGRAKLAQAMVQTYSAEEREKYGNKKMDYFLRVPAHLVIVMQEDPRQKVWEEDYAAVCSLIQNFQLAAWEQGLGVVWKTNHYSFEPDFRTAIGIRPGEKIVGVLHIGYPEIIPPARPRTAAEERLTIVEHS